MMVLFKLFLSAALIFTTFGLNKLLKAVYRQWTSPLRHFPGPPSPSFLYGNIKQIFNAVSYISEYVASIYGIDISVGKDRSVLHEKWVEEYGNTIKYKGFFHVCQVISF
jgi:hypothetical protein